MREKNIQFTNREGIVYNVSITYLTKEICVGNKLVSYQLLRMKYSGLFSTDELYGIAATIEELKPHSLINWISTFDLLEKQKPSLIRKKLKALHLL